jgi:HEAT repeats
MRRALALVTLVSFISLAHAGDKKPITPERVGQLLTILRSDLNEDNRTHAAEELGRVDASHYPEIIPLLIETMRNDPKPAVRAEVVDSLAKIRPLTKEAGKAIETAKEDGSFKVRWHARTAARVYHNAGYQEQEKKVAATPAKSPAAAPRSTTEPAATGQSGGWLSGMFGKSSPAPAPATPPQPAPASQTPPQTSGWLYHMMAKPAPTNKVPATTTEPPLAGPDPALLHVNPDPPTQQPTSNPFANIRSAPAIPVTQPQPAPLSPYPIIPVLPSKPEKSESNLIPN